jgi:hypothetical protein
MLCPRKQAAQEERRTNNVVLLGIKLYNPGIKREEVFAEVKYLEHDKVFSLRDPEKWQTEYSLREHCAVVSKVASAISAERGADERSVLLAKIAGLFHDAGKLDVACHLYRLNRRLTGKEKSQVDKHERISSKYLKSRLQNVRTEDRKLLKEACVPIRRHHEPWLVFRKKLRLVAWDVMMADIFNSLMENRHRPGLSQFEAIEFLPEIVSKKVPRFFRRLYGGEIHESLSAISRLYGKEAVLSALEA